MKNNSNGVLLNKHKHNNNAASYNRLGPEYQAVSKRVHSSLLYYPGSARRGSSRISSRLAAENKNIARRRLILHLSEAGSWLLTSEVTCHFAKLTFQQVELENQLVVNECIGDDTKAVARQSLNCIKTKIKYGKK